ncbi:MAG: hypothetical protein IPN71_10025 [Fibrobacteres bacterium]|nr:hypothetical protein [Fibrobacterota bacterium]
MRLTQETKSGVAQSWGYDEVSNRTSQVAGGNTVAATFDIRDRLTSLGTTTYTWDVAGRLASRNVSGVGTTRLGWQDGDRLRRVDLPNGNVVDYTYDAQGLMATRTDASGTERYTWDGTLPYGQMIATTNASGALQAREVWGTDHLAEIRNDTILWLLTDGLGHVRAVTDSVGQIIGRQDFDAWGNRTLDSGLTVRFGYRGEWSDPATGLVYLRARWMDPTTGRFVSEDPYEGDPNGPVSLHRYLYANSGPVNASDPTGKMASLSEAMTVNAIISTLMLINDVRLFAKAETKEEKAIALAFIHVDFLCFFAPFIGPEMRIAGFAGEEAILAMSVEGVLSMAQLNTAIHVVGQFGPMMMANKADIQQVRDVAREKGIKDVKKFSDYLHKDKSGRGMGGADHRAWEELLELADEFIETLGRRWK